MRRTLALSFAVSLLSATAAQAVPLFSDNFDSEALGLSTGLDNWTISDGTIDVIGAGGSFDFYPGNGHYLDLDGSSGNAGKITTNTAFNLLPGTYTLNFQLGGSTRGDSNSVTVALGSIYNEVFTLAFNAGLQNISRTITLAAAAGSGALSFENAGGDNLGLILDDVSLDFSRVQTDVPEPSSLALLALGGIAGVARRRRARG
jgi:hypothetical protein